MYSNQTNPEILNSINEVKVPYCDFSDPKMLNLMAQFYYDSSLMHPQINEDGTVTTQRITGFLGVVASSELSCDVVCNIRFLTYNPITGENYRESDGCASSYTEDETFRDCPFCYRRFYFIRSEYDPQGIFSVTGCTFQDYTAPDAMVLSYDPEANLVASLPKTWDVRDKQASIVDIGNLMNDLQSGRIAAQAGQGLFDVGLMVVASKAGEVLGGQIGRKAVSKAGALVVKEATEAATEAAAKEATETAVDAATDAAEAAAKGGMPITGGVLGGLGAGLLSSLYLDKVINIHQDPQSIQVK